MITITSVKNLYGKQRPVRWEHPPATSVPAFPTAARYVSGGGPAQQDPGPGRSSSKYFKGPPFPLFENVS
jgi:hypothetical protein